MQRNCKKNVVLSEILSTIFVSQKRRHHKNLLQHVLEKPHCLVVVHNTLNVVNLPVPMPMVIIKNNRVNFF